MTLPRVAQRWETQRKLIAVAEGRPKIAQRFSVCARTNFEETQWCATSESPAPEGRTIIARRFSAGRNGKNGLSPGGTTVTRRRCRCCTPRAQVNDTHHDAEYIGWNKPKLRSLDADDADDGAIQGC